MSKLRIFIFEDDLALRELLTNFLSKQGYEVYAYEDPTACPVYQSACACQKTCACADILITDYKMPNMTGIDFLEQMKSGGCKIDSHRKVLISAACTEDVIERAKELGCHFMRKPFKLSEVKSWIEQCGKDIPRERQLGKVH